MRWVWVQRMEVVGERTLKYCTHLSGETNVFTDIIIVLTVAEYSVSYFVHSLVRYEENKLMMANKSDSA